MSSIVAVIAHGGHNDIFIRHLPFWLAHRLPVVVYHPDVDSPMVTHKCQYIPIGGNGHHGANVVVRWKRLLDDWVRRECDVTCFEGDSLCLGRTLPPCRGLTGILWHDKEGFIAPIYPNPPWSMDKASILKMWMAWQDCPFIEEDGQADRILGALAHQARVPIVRYKPTSFSRATIMPSDYPELIQALSKGARMIHGIKTEECLNICRGFA